MLSYQDPRAPFLIIQEPSFLQITKFLVIFHQKYTTHNIHDCVVTTKHIMHEYPIAYPHIFLEYVSL